MKKVLLEKTLAFSAIRLNTSAGYHTLVRQLNPQIFNTLRTINANSFIKQSMHSRVIAI